MVELHVSGSAYDDGELREVLWSAATAREIVADIARDIELGRLSRAQGLDLIDRVRQRAASDPTKRLPSTPLRGDRDDARLGASPGRKVPDGPRVRARRGASDSMRA